ncbi:hypothetical protein Aau02nite_91900 [Amorphoplanes auranticolor]|uniref:Uncharacterized protein n=1 Tax=Actinoplanes auranticolor TaxID=47988 RepID=A0A919W5M2_9ACTN|nr:hypothetical protein Aau02nite_91900 [Actinoplanes auranticolor]
MIRETVFNLNFASGQQLRWEADAQTPTASDSALLAMIMCAQFGVSARRVPAWVVQSVTALPDSVRDRLAEEMGTASSWHRCWPQPPGAVVGELPTEAGVTVDP